MGDLEDPAIPVLAAVDDTRPAAPGRGLGPVYLDGDRCRSRRAAAGGSARPRVRATRPSPAAAARGRARAASARRCQKQKRTTESRPCSRPERQDPAQDPGGPAVGPGLPSGRVRPAAAGDPSLVALALLARDRRARVGARPASRTSPRSRSTARCAGPPSARSRDGAGDAVPLPDEPAGARVFGVSLQEIVGWAVAATLALRIAERCCPAAGRIGPARGAALGSRLRLRRGGERGDRLALVDLDARAAGPRPLRVPPVALSTGASSRSTSCALARVRAPARLPARVASLRSSLAHARAHLVPRAARAAARRRATTSSTWHRRVRALAGRRRARPRTRPTHSGRAARGAARSWRAPRHRLRLSGERPRARRAAAGGARTVASPAARPARARLPDAACALGRALGSRRSASRSSGS
jgi:hypothetical protein